MIRRTHIQYISESECLQSEPIHVVYVISISAVNSPIKNFNPWKVFEWRVLGYLFFDESVYLRPDNT